MKRRFTRPLLAASGVGIITFLGRSTVPNNPTTVGFAYLLFVLAVASTWGFLEACVSSVLATLTYNFFFLPPVGTFTIADPQNWVALFSFLATSLVASQLSNTAKQRAVDALERQQDLERLYTFSRAILLIGESQPFPKQLVQKVAEVFDLSAAVLYIRAANEFYRAGPMEFEGMDDQLREAALSGTSFADGVRSRVITAIRLGSEPIASLALQGAQMPDSVLQGIGNLVAIGLERARAEDLAQQVEVVRESERLRTILLDAMAHELKTPLTSIKAATTSLLASPDQPAETRMELVKIANEETARLEEIIDEALEMARLDLAQIDIQSEQADLTALAREVAASIHGDIDDRRIEIVAGGSMPLILADRRLLKLAIKQLLDNALKYSPPHTPIQIKLHPEEGKVALDVTDHGIGIPPHEQRRIFERFYRSPLVQHQIPGSGLGLSIAYRIVEAHKGELSVSSRPGETTFRISLPLEPEGTHA